jgi:DNA-formamidopyrimidine glycosylase
MPEGHSIHRVANTFRDDYLGSKVKVYSPQGRFESDAKLVSGRTLIESRAVGKQLFLGFDNDLTIRIHLGIYGKWNFYNVPISKAPEIWGQVRARFGAKSTSADLRGPTVCEVIDQQAVDLVLKRLGPDPLNADPGGQEALRFLGKVKNSKVAIGAALMNQAVISGIGNVYRAELLFRAGLNPKVPGDKVSENTLLAIWDDAVKLMRIGVKKGVMLTRDNHQTGRVKLEDRYFVYKREGLPCRVCNKKVAMEEFLARKLYWCPKCQR